MRVLDGMNVKKTYKESVGVVGLGYVGQSMAAILSLKHDVKVFDIEASRYAKCLAKRQKLIFDLSVEHDGFGSLKPFDDLELMVEECEIIILALPTNYDELTKEFDTQALDDVIALITRINKNKIILIKSTIPVGYISKIRKITGNDHIVFSPEFLQEGNTEEDNMTPDRIVIGDTTQIGTRVGCLLRSMCINEQVTTIYCEASEAETVKLFANTYLAMRVAFFNELDNFCVANKLDSKKVLTAVCKDRRIGDGYNNPSFGFGGYCLPKDTKQLVQNFEATPNPLIKSITQSNVERKNFIVEELRKLEAKTIGVYLLRMKSNSDNFREAAIIDIIKQLASSVEAIVIYEPLCEQKEIFGCKVIKSIEEFNETSDFVVANRLDGNVHRITKPIYTRDVFGIN